MALGGTIRGKKTTLRLPTEADLETYNRWMADMRVRRAQSVWHEPAMPATWQDRFKEIAKEKMDVLWSIDAEGHVVGFAAGSFWSVTESGFTLRHFVIDPDEWRKGYGFDAALALHRYLFDYLDLRRSGVEFSLLTLILLLARLSRDSRRTQAAMLSINWPFDVTLAPSG